MWEQRKYIGSALWVWRMTGRIATILNRVISKASQKKKKNDISTKTWRCHKLELKMLGTLLKAAEMANSRIHSSLPNYFLYN
jgi:hypothetical protein